MDSSNELKKIIHAADLGTVAAMSGQDQETVICPFPKSWYPIDSPCSKTDGAVTGSKQDPWILPEDKAKLQAAWGSLTSLGPAVKTLGWIALGVTVVWLSVRGLEAYATISKD